MDRRGCGCLGFVTAVAVGVLAGVIGIGVAGYLWLDKSVLSDQPLELEKPKWSVMDEAAMTAKMAPVAASIKLKKEATYDLTFKPKEVNWLLDEYLLPGQADDLEIAVSMGDTAMIVDFSQRLLGKYLNGQLRAKVTGQEGDFEVEAYGFKTGDFTWPPELLAQVGQWAEGILETQKLFRDDPIRLWGISHDKKEIKLTVKTLAEQAPETPSP